MAAGAHCAGDTEDLDLGAVARHVTWLAAGFALCAALAGLLVDGLYAGAASTAAMLRGFDMVTAVLVVPALALSTWRARGGSLVAELFATSLVASLVYTYGYSVSTRTPTVHRIRPPSATAMSGRSTTMTIHWTERDLRLCLGPALGAHAWGNRGDG